jgi:general secretion pathway protein L
VTYVVPRSICFERDLSIPVAAADNAAQILELDLQRTTPFRVPDVWLAVKRQGLDPSDLSCAIFRQYVLPRVSIAAPIGAATKAGVSLKSVRIQGVNSSVLPINFLAPTDVRAAQASVWLRRGFWFTVATMLLSAGIFASVYFWQHEQAINALSAEIATATKQAQAVRRTASEADGAFGQAQRLRLRKVDGPSITAVWDDITKILPDDAWLTDLRIGDEMVQLDGLSRNASQLVALLSRLPQFAEVALAAPVTRDPQRDVERFQIRFVLAKQGFGAANAGSK